MSSGCKEKKKLSAIPLFFYRYTDQVNPELMLTKLENKTMNSGSFEQFLEAIGEFESGRPSGDPGQYRVSNPMGVSGKYQMNPGALFETGYISKLSTNPSSPWNVQWSDKSRQLGVNSYQDFLNQPAMQESAMRDLLRFNWDKMQEVVKKQGKSLENYIGQTRTYTKGNQTFSTQLTVSGLLYGAHSQGAWGMANQLLDNSSTNYGLSVIDKFGGYTVPTSITSNVSVSPTPTDPLPVDPTPEPPVSPAPTGNPINPIEGTNIEGTNNNDQLMGTNGDDQIIGRAGLDVIQAAAGNDRIFGGSGEDQLYGEEGNDRLKGNAGNDLLQGGLGNDHLFGGKDDDRLVGVDAQAATPGKNEQDFLKGDAGKDVFVLGNQEQAFYNDGVNSSQGRQDYARIKDFNMAQGDVIELYGQASDYQVETVSGSPDQAIFLKTAGEKELIALVEGETNALTLDSAAFRYVGNSSPTSPVDPMPPVNPTPPVDPTPPINPTTPTNPTTPEPNGDRWGNQFFAPYVDMGLYPVPDLDGIAKQTGVGLFNLGFMQSDGQGPAWAGIPALGLGSNNEQFLAMEQEIKQLQAIGGDVMVSFGGAAGTSLAQTFVRTNQSAVALKETYQSVISEFNLSHIDFDIEGGAVADPSSIALRSQAISLLQQENAGVDIWYTLPVLPSGLTAEGLNVVRSALEAGVDLDGINIMAMDYGDSAAPPDQATMGTYAIRAADNTFSQLTSLYGEYNQTIGWENIGVTPMIGVNDVTTEVFTKQDAQQLLAAAQERGMGMLSMWSMNRDQPAPSGQAGQVGIKHNGLSEAPYTFAGVFNDYGTPPALTPPSTTPGEPTGNTPDIVTGGTYTSIAVQKSDTLLQAKAGQAESFKLNYDWGHVVTIKGFDPTEDRLDLSAFWNEANNASLGVRDGNARLSLDFNNQTVILEGVGADQINQVQLLKAA